MTTEEFFNYIRGGNLKEVREAVEDNPLILEEANNKGFAPLIMATYMQQLDITNELLDQGANVNRQDMVGNTALMGVCFKGHTGLAQTLLDHGAEINLKNSNGATALIYAASFGHSEIVQLLLDADADATIKDLSGNTAYTHAQTNNHNQIVDLLKGDE